MQSLLFRELEERTFPEMKKILFAIATVVAFCATTSSASAQVIATAPTGGGCATCAQGPSAEMAPAYAGYPGHFGGMHGHMGGMHGHPMYGLNPHIFRPQLLSRIAGNHKDYIDRIAFYQFKGFTKIDPTMEAAQGGTLVFPQNPFIRSPRDFFMQP